MSDVTTIDWDKLSWVTAEVTSYQGRVLVRRNGAVYPIGLALPAFAPQLCPSCGCTADHAAWTTDCHPEGMRYRLASHV